MATDFTKDGLLESRSCYRLYICKFAVLKRQGTAPTGKWLDNRGLFHAKVSLFFLNYLLSIDRSSSIGHAGKAEC